MDRRRRHLLVELRGTDPVWIGDFGISPQEAVAANVSAPRDRGRRQFP